MSVMELFNKMSRLQINVEKQEDGEREWGNFRGDSNFT